MLSLQSSFRSIQRMVYNEPVLSYGKCRSERVCPVSLKVQKTSARSFVLVDNCRTLPVKIVRLTMWSYLVVLTSA